MKYRRIGSVFLLLIMIGFCLYVSRESHTEQENADSSNNGEKRLTQAESLEVADISEEMDYSEESEYEYSVEEIECGQGRTAQVERFYYPQDNRAEFIVTSELLNYTAKLQSRESEESAEILILTMDVELMQDGKPAKSQQIEWQCNDDIADYSIYYGAEMVDLICPNFQDANRDGYLDFLVLNYFTSREGWHTIFVWDTETEEYVQVKIDGSEYTERISSDPKFYDGYVEQWSIVGFYEQRFERFRWEGNELVLEDEIRMQEDAE